MTKEKFKENTLYLLKDSYPEIERLIDTIIASGCLDIEAMDKDDFISSKSVISAIFLNLSYSYRPLSGRGIVESKNISKFI